MTYIIAKHSIGSTPVLTTEKHYRELEAKLIPINESINIIVKAESLEAILLMNNNQTLDILL
jgi:hypothetical protein